MFAKEKQVRHILVRVPDPHILDLWGRILYIDMFEHLWSQIAVLVAKK